LWSYHNYESTYNATLVTFRTFRTYHHVTYYMLGAPSLGGMGFELIVRFVLKRGNPPYTICLWWPQFIFHATNSYPSQSNFITIPVAATRSQIDCNIRFDWKPGHEKEVENPSLTTLHYRPWVTKWWGTYVHHRAYVSTKHHTPPLNIWLTGLCLLVSRHRTIVHKANMASRDAPSKLPCCVIVAIWMSLWAASWVEYKMLVWEWKASIWRPFWFLNRIAILP